MIKFKKRYPIITGLITLFLTIMTGSIYLLVRYVSTLLDTAIDSSSCNVDTLEYDVKNMSIDSLLT